MQKKKLPYSKRIYFLGLLSCILFFFGGIPIVLALASLMYAKKAEKLYEENPQDYSNYGKIKKGKIIAMIGLGLNIFAICVTIWTLATIGWDAWSEEFVRKWNEGLENRGR